MLRIADLESGDTDGVRQVAELLIAGFHEHSPHPWPDLASALAEVEESFGRERLSRVARDDEGQVLGWIGGISQYDGHVWELHPLVVHVDYQGQGIGRALVWDLEARVRERGGLTITLGTDDDHDQTTLSGINLFPDIYSHIARIQNLRHHPYEFYQKLGYTIVGVVPDANGIGKPDILMAKSLAKHTNVSDA